MASDTPPRPATPEPAQLPPVPSSPVYSIASTANAVSQFNLPPPPAPRPAHAVLTKTDLARSHDAYADLVASAKAYRLALAALSSAASAFGAALEACARLKEARADPIGGGPGAAAAGGPGLAAGFPPRAAAAPPACTADSLLAASGVHHLVANHQQILSETVYRAFEVPLLHDLDRWQTVMDDEEQTYQHRIRAQTREVKRLEKEGLKLHKQRRRDVARFRAHLVDLTAKLDGLTTLHADHARTLLRECQETSARIVDASCSLVRAEVDIFEGLARKGWSGGGLDDLLDKGRDLFAADDAAAAAADAPPPNKLFSILPPKSILADAASDPSRTGGYARGDSLLTVDDRAAACYQSLAAAVTVPDAARPPADSDSVLSADMSRPRPPRPFSPQPIRRVPADVTFDSLGACTEDDGPGRENGERDKEHGKEHDEEHGKEHDEEHGKEHGKEHDEEHDKEHDKEHYKEHEDEQDYPADNARGRTTTPSPLRPSTSSSETAANPCSEPRPGDDARE